MKRYLIQRVFLSAFLLGNLAGCSVTFSQQNDSLLLNTLEKKTSETFKISGYLDAYYSYYSDYFLEI